MQTIMTIAIGLALGLILMAGAALCATMGMPTQTRSEAERSESVQAFWQARLEPVLSAPAPEASGGGGGAATASVAVTGDIDKGRALSMTCVACHGQNMEGVKLQNAPGLAGQHGWYLRDALKKFKAGQRGYEPTDVPGVTMKGMVATLPTDEAIDDVVAYLVSLDAKQPEATLQGNVENGKAKFALCIACHGTKAEGNAQLKAPRLQGQNDWYIVNQLANFKKGHRGKAEGDVMGAQMIPFATMLSEQDMKDVAAYIQTLGD